MARQLVFDFTAWDDSRDVLLQNASNQRAFVAVQSAIELGKTQTKRERQRDPALKGTIEGITGLLASCIEWLRWYGETPEEIQAAVRGHIQRNRTTQANKLQRDNFAAFKVSDPSGDADRIDKDKVLG